MMDYPGSAASCADQDWFVGAVLFHPGDFDTAHIRGEFARMKDLGMNMVRLYHAWPHETAPGVFDFSRVDRWMDTAADAGLRVIQHLEWFLASDALLADERIDRPAYERAHAGDPRYQAVVRRHYGPMIERYRRHPALYLWGILGEPDPGPARLAVADRLRFGQWLQSQYGDLASLNAAWTLYPENDRPLVTSFDQAWTVLSGFDAEEKISGVHRAMRNYGAARDLIRFATEHSFARARCLIDLIRHIDPDHSIVIGAHQLFLNQPELRWDIPRWAKLADVFTTSIHLSWHFELVHGEIDRPVYLQARLTRDANKTGWTSCYETTAGPVQYSGGYGNSMSPGLMRRLMLSYLAAGNNSIAFWTWNPRPGGWEGGEYGLIDLAGQLTPWAVEAGAIARAMARWRHELAAASAEPQVGIVRSWDTDALLTLEPQRHDLADGLRFAAGTRTQAERARIGAGRAMINQQRSFEYLTTDELIEGLAARYRVLLLPHLRTLDARVIEALHAFVAAGGRLIADVPFAFNSPTGKVLHAGPQSPSATLFGASCTAIHDARTEPRRLGDVAVDGFFADLALAGGRVLARFDNGSPAIVEKSHGAGSAVLIGSDLMRLCHLPGNLAAEQLLGDLVGGSRHWHCTTAPVFRRRCPQADHYFLINDGPARTAILFAHDASYESALDVITGQALDLGPTLAFELPERSARWIRLQRSVP